MEKMSSDNTKQHAPIFLSTYVITVQNLMHKNNADLFSVFYILKEKKIRRKQSCSGWIHSCCDIPSPSDLVPITENWTLCISA